MIAPEIAMGPALWARFSSKFMPEPHSGCWLWFGCAHEGGYSRMMIEGHLRPVHRYIFERCNGCELPPDILVCHKCDTPACINPDHLLVGTQIDNLADSVSKGRMHPGERNGRAKLTDRQAAAIIADPRRYKAIAAEYGIHVEHVGAIKRGVRRAPGNLSRRKGVSHETAA